MDYCTSFLSITLYVDAVSAVMKNIIQEFYSILQGGLTLYARACAPAPSTFLVPSVEKIEHYALLLSNDLTILINCSIQRLK